MPEKAENVEEATVDGLLVEMENNERFCLSHASCSFFTEVAAVGDKETQDNWI